ncbi:MAG: hypothetical protein ABI859_00265 [Pseudomonadota bacterium]
MKSFAAKGYVRLPGYSPLRRAMGLLVMSLAASTVCSASEPPDFSGVWGDPSTGEEAPTAHLDASELAKLFQPIVLPAGEPVLKEPYATEYRAHLAEKKKASAGEQAPADSHTQCVPEGMPHMMIMPMLTEIVQTRKTIFLMFEYLGQIRRIYLNEKMPPVDEINPTLTGYSVGHWEGDTLIVETRGIRKDAMFFHIPHSEDMRIVERLRRNGSQLEDHIVVEDPKALAQPYVITFRYKLAPARYKLSEYLCENNRYKDDAGTDFLDLRVEPSD